MTKTVEIYFDDLKPEAQIGLDNYDFDNLNSPHVVNCPTPMTIDVAIHRARTAGT